MNLKDLKERFEVSKKPKAKGVYLIYEKDPHTGSRMVHKYLCEVHKKSSNSFYVQNHKPTTSLDVLETQIRSYVKSLPYDSEYYYPLYRDGIFEEFLTHDYMISIGFKSAQYSNDNFTYELEQKNIYNFKSSNIEISFWGLDAWDGYKDGKFNIQKTIKIVLHTGDWSFISLEVNRSFEDIKKGIDSILKPLYITESVENLKRADQLTDMESVDLMINKVNVLSDNISVSYKEELKRRLQETLDKLQ